MKHTHNNNSSGIWSRITAPFGNSLKNTEDFKQILKLAFDKMLIDADVYNLTLRAMESTHKQARDIMVPRPQVKALEASARPDEWIEEIIASKHSRYPVIDGSLDKTCGLLLPKDLIPLLKENGSDSLSLEQLLRPVNFVPESQSLHQLLATFRKLRSHLVLVMDEHGGVAGLVTLEDALEEIIGEIEDEHDEQMGSNIYARGGGVWEVNALTTIEELNQTLGVSLSNNNVETIGGLITLNLQHIPRTDDELEINGLNIKVLRAQQRRAELLRIKVPAASVMSKAGSE